MKARTAAKRWMAVDAEERALLISWLSSVEADGVEADLADAYAPGFRGGSAMLAAADVLAAATKPTPVAPEEKSPDE